MKHATAREFWETQVIGAPILTRAAEQGSALGGPFRKSRCLRFENGSDTHRLGIGDKAVAVRLLMIRQS